MIKFKLIIFAFCCLTAMQALSQQEYSFTAGLSAAVDPRYGREAIYTDKLAYKLYMGNLEAPEEGTVFGTDGKGGAITWKQVVADSLGRLRSSGGFRYG